MEKEEKKHGLTDMQEGEFILNESGTFITTDQMEPSKHSRKENNKKEESRKESIIISSSGPEEKDITD